MHQNSEKERDGKVLCNRRNRVHSRLPSEDLAREGAYCKNHSAGPRYVSTYARSFVVLVPFSSRLSAKTTNHSITIPKLYHFFSSLFDRGCGKSWISLGV